jgi:hypothetical protein
VLSAVPKWTIDRKTLANAEAVNERQQIASLARDEKAQARVVTSKTDKMDQLRAQRDKLKEDAESCTKLKNDVRITLIM